MTNLETVRVLEGVALQHGFVGRLVKTVTINNINNIIFPKKQLVIKPILGRVISFSTATVHSCTCILNY